VKRPSYPTCIFCGRNEHEPSIEDVIPKWIARQFPDGTKSRFDVVQGRYLEDPRRNFKTRGHLGWLTKGACKDCNNGWMSALENRAKVSLEPMMHGASCTLPPEDVAALAQWQTKTTFMFEYMRYRSGRYFRPDQLSALFTGLSVPAGTIIDAAHHLGPRQIRILGGPMRVHLIDPSLRLKAFCLTIVIDHLALQLFSARRHYQDVYRPPQWRDGTCRIWPPRGTVQWPPRLALDTAALEAFATRYVDDTTITNTDYF
jgi:hypothetical protein